VLPHTWHDLIANLLQIGESHYYVSLLEKLVRPVLVYLLLVYGLKTFGKRILAQFNAFDFVLLLMLSNTVQNAIVGHDDSLAGGIIGAAALLAVNVALVRLHYRGARTEMEETDMYLVRDGVVQENELRRLQINRGELTAKAHEHGFDDLRQVQAGVLYPNGTIYFKGGESSEDRRLDEILRQLHALRQELVAMRR
jgi:uncharacterized membrane protein YcaP (DUF421 family)